MPDDLTSLHRRLDKVEERERELSKILTDLLISSGRVNDALIELRQQIPLMTDMSTRLHTLEYVFSAIKWVAGTVVGTGIVLIISYLFQVAPQQ